MADESTALTGAAAKTAGRNSQESWWMSEDFGWITAVPRSMADCVSTRSDASLPVQQLLQLVEHAVQILVCAAQLVDLGDRVHHGGVVLVAELAADLRQAGLGHLLD